MYREFFTRKIREKLDESDGHASIKLFRGDSCEISYDSNEKGLVSPKIQVPDQLTWEVFDLMDLEESKKV